MNQNSFFELPPVKAAKSMIENVFDFNTRTSRSDFWWAMLAVFVVNLVLQMFFRFANMLIPVRFFTVLIYGISSLVELAFICLELAISVRRLHDTHKTGWFMLLALTIIGFIPLIIWWCQVGDPQPNQYGPVPQSVT